MKIITSNHSIELLIKRMVDIVLLNDGRIHENVTFIHDEIEGFSITCVPITGNEVLLSIPDHLFIPVTQLQWTQEQDRLTFSGELNTLSGVQQELLHLMVELYNRTNKISSIRSATPALQVHHDSDLDQWIKNSRSSFNRQLQSTANYFISTRVYEKSSDDMPDGKIGYLMPLIDLLNHHPYGPKYQFTESLTWEIPLLHPVPGSQQCYVRYNKADCLPLAMWHGYFEPATRYVSSLDVLIHHPIIGTVRIKGTSSGRRTINAPRVLTQEPVLTLLDVVLEENKLFELRVLLSLAIRSRIKTLTQPNAEMLAADLISQIITENSNKYRELLSICQMPFPGKSFRPLFEKVATHQLNLLNMLAKQ